jgi:hypothetical protein
VSKVTSYAAGDFSLSEVKKLASFICGKFVFHEK